MITVISGTNRKDSNTKKIAKEYIRLLEQKNLDCQLLALDECDSIIKKGPDFDRLQEKYLFPTEKFIILMPEYNGSYPGILKLLIDYSDVRQAWWYKKALLTGVSTGRAGNLRGMEHLSGVMLHMRMQLHYNRLPLSNINTVLGADDQIEDQVALSAVENQINEFLAF